MASTHLSSQRDSRSTIFGRLFTISLLFLSGVTIFREVRDFCGWNQHYDTTWTQALGSIVSPATADAIETDPILRRNFLAVVDLTADLSGSLAEKYQLPELEKARAVIDEYKRRLSDSPSSSLSKRLFGIGEDKSTDNPALKPILDFFQPVVDTFKNVGQALLPDLNAPAFFLGLGLGEGTAQGLNLTTAPNAKATAQRIAKDNNMDPGGLNGPIESLGIGLGGSLVGSIDFASLGGGDLQPIALALAEGLGNGTAAGLKLSPRAVAITPPRDTSIKSVVGTFGFGLTKSITSNLDLDGGLDLEALTKDLPLSRMALSLAEGMGNGTSLGLKLTTRTDIFPPMGSSLPDALGAFGFGLTKRITENLDTSNILPRDLETRSLQPRAFEEVIPTLGRVALKLGEGLGNGTAVGLKLTERNLSPSPDAADIPSVAGNFAYGLSKSLSENINFTSIAEEASSGVNTTEFVLKYLPSAAAGLGKGLGEGIPIGLGIQEDRLIPMREDLPDGEIDVGAIAENFAKGLTSGMLQNGTLEKLMSNMSAVATNGGDGFGSNLKLGMVTQGFARGFVQGAGDAIESLGGVDALIEGRAKMPEGGLPNETIWFDDSVNGAACGFGQGLGGQVVLVAYMLLDKENGTSLPGVASTSTAIISTTTTAALSPPAGPTSIPTPARIRREIAAPRSHDALPQSLTRRQAANPLANLDLSALLSADTISFAAQKTIDTLTCKGVGGVSLILAGLAKSGVIPTEALKGGDGEKAPEFITKAVPTGVIRVRSEGHLYELDGRKVGEALGEKGGSLTGALSVNGFPVSSFLAFVVVHVLFGVGVFVIILPLALGLESAQNVAFRARLPHALPAARKWTNIMWLAGVVPGLVLVLVFGALILGNTSHFRSAHGILGLITILCGILAVGLHVMVKVRQDTPSGDASALDSSSKRTRFGAVRTGVNQVFLILSLASCLQGFASLSSVTLCLTHTVSFELAVALGFVLSGAFVLGASISGLDLFLSLREWRRGTRKITKEEISAPVG